MNVPLMESSNQTKIVVQQIKDVERLGRQKCGYFTWKVWREKVAVFLHDREEVERREAQGDSSRPPRLRVTQPSHPRSTWRIWSEDRRYSSSKKRWEKKASLREESDWRESLTFKQALYPYRVGEDMHNPSKMHMNFPSSNSSRLNSSQWINYEYCMHRIGGDKIEFTEGVGVGGGGWKKKNSKK